jgi:hypothetical protein
MLAVVLRSQRGGGNATKEATARNIEASNAWSFSAKNTAADVHLRSTARADARQGDYERAQGDRGQAGVPGPRRG